MSLNNKHHTEVEMNVVGKMTTGPNKTKHTYEHTPLAFELSHCQSLERASMTITRLRDSILNPAVTISRLPCQK